MSREVITVYVSYGVIELGGKRHVTGVTWMIEQRGEQRGHHYFADYPGVKESERQLTEVVGGNPLTRYSLTTVLTAFVNDIPEGAIVVFMDAAKRSAFLDLLSKAGITMPSTSTTLDNVLFVEDERESIMDFMEDIRQTAAGQFGSSL